MENYYTTRFHPHLWPPVGTEIPPGVELIENEFACCAAAEVGPAETRPLESPWTYRSTYRIACPRHGETRAVVECRLDWISPNEYLLIRAVGDR